MPHAWRVCNACACRGALARAISGHMRKVERPALLVLAAVIAFAALKAAVIAWGLR